MLMSPNKDETSVHGCHYQGDMLVRMCKVLAIKKIKIIDITKIRNELKFA